MSQGVTVGSVLDALDHITGGRLVRQWNAVVGGRQPFVVDKSSGIPGKGIVEIPGLVVGTESRPVRRLGVVMTLTECVIELCGAAGIDLVVAHHPVADAASSGGVPLRSYLGLYDLALVELHEAFHGLHPGIPYLHGHRAHHCDTAFGGLPGNVLFVGEALPEVRVAGDILARLEGFCGWAVERDLARVERELRAAPHLIEALETIRPALLVGGADRPVHRILHFFPHGGFSADHLARALEAYPETDTVIASISRVRVESPLVALARSAGLNFIVGNSHALEVWENGLPLAFALERLLTEVEILILCERVTAVPLAEAGTAAVRRYAREMAANHLILAKEVLPG